jgi:hypothetical protein
MHCRYQQCIESLTKNSKYNILSLNLKLEQALANVFKKKSIPNTLPVLAAH